MGGICDDKQRLCFAVALWNGRDPILKERLFGLTNSEGNHGEDVKEYYFYIDSTPTHSYMKYLTSTPQSEFPYRDLLETNRSRSREEFEYELLDTGVFDDDRYFDVFVEYAKEGPEDVLIRITAHNRGPEAATLHVLPTLWFRNTWSWGEVIGSRRCTRWVECHRSLASPAWDLPAAMCRFARAALYGERDQQPAIVGSANTSPYVKDAFHDVRGFGTRRLSQSRAGRNEGCSPLPHPQCARRRQPDRCRLQLTAGSTEAALQNLRKGLRTAGLP